MNAAVEPAGHVVADVEERRVIARQVREQALDRCRVGRREVDVAAPDPAGRLLRHERVQRGRLGIVDDADVPPARQLAGVHLVVALPDVPLLVRQVLRVALQRVVHELGGVEELLAPVDDLPLDVEPDVAHERHEREQDLRHAAAERGGRQVQHPLPGQRRRQLPDLLDERPADEVGVVGEALVGEWDGLEHERPEDTRSAAAGRGRQRPVAELDVDVAAFARRARPRP